MQRNNFSTGEQKGKKSSFSVPLKNYSFRIFSLSSFSLLLHYPLELRIYIQSQDFDICFFSFHDCWDYWQNGLAKSERAIVAMTTAVIAMAVTNTSIDSRSIVSIIILLIFFVAKISGIKRLYNQNLTETEKSASQSPESAFETISEVSVHLLPNSRLRRRYDRKMQRMHARIIRSEWSEVHFPV